jgi:hypothetical protein
MLAFAMKRRDVNQTAFDTLQQAIGVMRKGNPERKTAAAEKGREGGLKGGAARARLLTKDQHKQIAKKAASKRWQKKALTQYRCV